jgi:hypothetical protein
MPIGALLGAVGGALLFGIMAARNGDVAVERLPLQDRDQSYR